MKSTAVRILGSILICAAVAACTSSAATPSASPTASPTAAPTATPTPAPTPSPTPAPTPTPAPPADPTGVKMVDLTPPAKCPSPYGASCFAYKVTWTEADPTGVTINVYAVTKCLAKPHCLTATTAIPAADLSLRGSAAAGSGTLSFIVGDGETNGDGWFYGLTKNTLFVYAVVVQASSTAGKSGFVIAWTW